MPKDFVNKNVSYKPQLAREAWQMNRIRPEVRYKLLNAAKMFIDSIDVTGFVVLDVVLTGSMANYNYTKFSDFDVHIITSYARLQCDDVAEEFYQAKKRVWNDAHDIIVRGHEVEMYVEDNAKPPVSGGIYSLLDDKWLKVPSYDPPKIDDRAINLKVSGLIKHIDHAITRSDEPEDIRRLLDKLRRMRQAGLDENGEFSVENLAYKILRNLGYLDRLYSELNDKIDAELSL